MGGGEEFLDKWAVHVKGGTAAADAVAQAHGFRNLGKIGSIADHYHFQHRCDGSGGGCIPRTQHSGEHTDRLLKHPHVHWAEQQRKRHRSRRSIIPNRRYSTAALVDNATGIASAQRTRRMAVPDPLWDRQWYLHGNKENDINVQPAWDKGYTGHGVVVTVVDDGIEHTHPDLHDNYDPEASTDINGGDDDPFPNEADPINKHGTRCCGEIASLRNDKCGIGIAFGCKIGAVRMLDGDVTDSVEAHSLSLAPQHIDIYSNSWGPNDDGRTIEGPASLAQRAIEDGITFGRGGKGSIYVFASGNGGSSGDSCNCDGYCNSIYTIAIGAVTEDNNKPYYTEPCSATLAVTYSSGSGRQRSITTVDLHNGCTSSHSGTSAAAPLAAGIFALVLEANPALTWRDLQHLVVRTSRQVDGSDSSWHTNAAGRRFSTKYGYGSLDTAALVDAAERWTLVGNVIVSHVEARSADMTSDLTGAITIGEDSTLIRELEHVQVTVDLATTRRGNTRVHITCPSGTKSELMPYRYKDSSGQSLQWTFMTVECWDESPLGTFTIEATTKQGARATLRSWSITLHGTALGTASGSNTGATASPSSQPSTQPSRAPTEHPTTAAPTTRMPTTHAPTTAAPTTAAPITFAPTTLAPMTETQGVTTFSPTSSAPITAAPTTLAPTTSAPTSTAPSTSAPRPVDCSEALCEVGTYQLRLNEDGFCFNDPTRCRPCLPGHRCPDDTVYAIPCGLGYFGGTSKTQCYPCRVGYYSDTLASTSCKIIEPGFYGIGGDVTSRQGVRVCPAGNYCLGGSQGATLCAKNTSQSATGQVACAPCASGTHQPLEGQSSCVNTSTQGDDTSAMEVPTGANSAPSMMTIGVVAGGVLGLSFVMIIVLVAKSCRSSGSGVYAIATEPDRFSIDDHDSDDDEVADHFDPKYVPQSPADGPVVNAVFSGMKDALGNDDSAVEAWHLTTAARAPES